MQSLSTDPSSVQQDMAGLSIAAERSQRSVAPTKEDKHLVQRLGDRVALGPVGRTKEKIYNWGSWTVSWFSDSTKQTIEDWRTSSVAFSAMAHKEENRQLLNEQYQQQQKSYQGGQ